MSVMTADTAVQIYHNAMDTGNFCNVVSTGYRGNGGHACSYGSTVTS